MAVPPAAMTDAVAADPAAAVDAVVLGVVGASVGSTFGDWAG
jgi:hypothetical protein